MKYPTKRKNLKVNFTLVLFLSFVLFFSCETQTKTIEKNSTNPDLKELTAKDILGNPDYQAISYGGYRQNTRDVQPTMEQLKEDMKLLAAMNIKVLRTYNTHFPHASNVLEAIDQLKKEDPNFEMYVMLGTWINCKDAFTANPNHEEEDAEANAAEIQRAVDLAKKYDDIVKVIAVGNEAMVKWAASYFVQPGVILKWVNHLQKRKEDGHLSKNLWITSSDNFASWGGGGKEYHVKDLEELIKAVDYVSLHTYPMHDTHYNPDFWGILEEESHLTKVEQIDAAMQRALAYAKKQYGNTAKYVDSIAAATPIHIGETGWASASNSFYGPDGSKATDEYKEGIYYQLMRDWTNKDSISCFYFEAFDENWKDAGNPGGSENHFGLINLQGQAKYAIWGLVDAGAFEGLKRGENTITKTYKGNKEQLLKDVKAPPIKAVE